MYNIGCLLTALFTTCFCIYTTFTLRSVGFSALLRCLHFIIDLFCCGGGGAPRVYLRAHAITNHKNLRAASSHTQDDGAENKFIGIHTLQVPVYSKYMYT